MTRLDIILIILIGGGACYLLYRSLWQKKGHCGGCADTSCHRRPGPGPNNSP